MPRNTSWNSWTNPDGWGRDQRRKELPKDWPAIRERILRRDRYRCQWRNPYHPERQCTARATQVDHIKRGNDHSPGNLQSLCAEHHNAKSACERNESRLGLAPKRTKPGERFEPHPGMTPD